MKGHRLGLGLQWLVMTSSASSTLHLGMLGEHGTLETTPAFLQPGFDLGSFGIV